MSNIKFIKNTFEKYQKTRKEYFIFDVLAFINDPLPDDINFNNVKKRLEKTIPKKLFKEIDYIYVGDFPELKLRDVQSVYLRGAIYISNEQQNEDSLYASIVHELGHSIETVFGPKIYQDNEIAAEFIGKRKKLRSILKAQDIEYEDPNAFLRIEYSPNFDKFLYETVGYDLLNQLCVGLFVSPYGATSLREYFANGFEHYYLFDREYLGKVSPKLYNKLYSLTKK
jgi:hypothetical protein